MVATPAERGDDLTDLLDQVADAAEETAATQQEVARQARAAADERAEGRSWQHIIDHGSGRGLLELVRRSAQTAAEAAGRLRSAVAHALTNEGLTTRQIAKRFGVTHQRISALTRRPPPVPRQDDEEDESA